MAHDNLPSEPTFSYWSGIFLPVEYKGYSIVAHNSSWTSRIRSGWTVRSFSVKAAGSSSASRTFKQDRRHWLPALAGGKRGFIFEVFDDDTLVASADYPINSLGWKQVLPFALLGMALGFSVEHFNLLG